MALTFYCSVAKGLKVKVEKFWGLITFIEVTGEKLIGGLFAPTSLSSHSSYKGLRNVQKDPSISNFADVSTLFTVMTNFLENQNSEFTEKLFLGAYNSKSYVIQVLGSNCIESNSLYSQKD